MTLTKSQIETFAIDLLKKQGYQYIYGQELVQDSVPSFSPTHFPKSMRGELGWA